MNLAQTLEALSLSDPRPLAQTPRANLWRVQMSDGRDAVLKRLTAQGAASDEARAADVLAQWAGNGAAQIYQTYRAPPCESGHGGICFVMEWLDGPSLGDVARDGNDTEATAQLAQVACTLSRPAVEGFPDLSTNGADLARMDIAKIPDTYRANFMRAKTCWQELLSSTTHKRLLHGDLHHDNVLKGSRGLKSEQSWCAIDPRGLNGDPAYEFANAFRNPVGMKGKAADPARMQHMADVFAQTSGLERTRILQFAFAHCALSLSWSLKNGPAPKGDLRILDILAKLSL
jgi:streptomycin 6-kinase